MKKDQYNMEQYSMSVVLIVIGRGIFYV